MLLSIALSLSAQDSRAEPRCVPDAEGAKAKVEAGFADLGRLHRARLPGPSGEALLERRLEILLDGFIGFGRFVDDVLGEAWENAGDHRSAWRETLADTLRQRYLGKVGSPLGVRLEFVALSHRCDEARVEMLLHKSGRKRPREVVLRLYFETPSEGTVEVGEVGAAIERASPQWRAFDVAVDGVSLLETWRGRFRKIYNEGGVAAVDAHMRSLRERYPRKL